MHAKIPSQKQIGFFRKQCGCDEPFDINIGNIILNSASKLPPDCSIEIYRDYQAEQPADKWWVVDIYPSAIRDGYDCLSSAEGKDLLWVLFWAVYVILEEGKLTKDVADKHSYR